MTRRIRSQSKDTNLVAKRRQLIMRAAMRVFTKTGYKSATMRQIASACRMTPGNIYRYIGSKKDILRINCEYSENASHVYKEKLMQSLTGNSITDLQTAIRSFFQLCDDEAADRIVVNTREQPYFSNNDKVLIEQSSISLVKIFEELITNGNEQGVMHCEDPKFLANIIVFLGYDWALRRTLLRGSYNLREYTDNQINMVMDNISKRKTVGGKTASKINSSQ